MEAIVPLALKSWSVQKRKMDIYMTEVKVDEVLGKIGFWKRTG